MYSDLIDTYVTEIGRRLPRKSRADIQAEIRSTLQDMLEEQSRKLGKPVDDQITLDVLKAYGSPQKVAATYLGDRYLIGPGLYPTFILVVRIVLIVLGVLAAIGLGVTVYRSFLLSMALPQEVLKTIGNFLVGAFLAFGNIVLVFAVLERTLFSSDKNELADPEIKKEWDPQSLSKITPANRINAGERIIEVIGCFAAIAIFNFYPQMIGIGSGLNGFWFIGAGSTTVIPILSATFFSYVPYLTIAWILTIILDILLLSIGTWSILTRLGLIGLKLINILIAALMLSGPSILALTGASLATILGNVDWAASLMNSLNEVVRVLLWVTILGNGIEIIRAVSGMFNGNPIAQPAGNG